PLDAGLPQPLTPGSDIIVVRTVRSNAPLFRTSGDMASGTSDVVIEKNAGEVVRANMPLIISDCEKATVFAPSAVVDAGATATLSHTAGAAPAGLTANVAAD